MGLNTQLAAHEHERIARATIGPFPHPLPSGMLDPMPTVTVTTETGVVVELFTFYPDELSFSPEEFVGKTVAAGRRMKFEKDRQFLRGR